MASVTERIAQIEAILSGGVANVSTESESVAWDHDALRLELKRLRDQSEDAMVRRPPYRPINLGGF